MAKRKFTNQEILTGVFFLLSGSVRRTKDDKLFWDGVFKIDRDTDLKAKIWDNKGEVEMLKDKLIPRKFYKVQGKIDTRYSNEPQLIVSSIEETDTNKIDLSSYMKKSQIPKGDMVKEFDEIVSEMVDPHFKKLLETFRNHELFEKYIVSPAAKQIHHNWLSGLLEHSLTLAKAVIALHPLYPSLNKNLLLCGAFLHDVGKVFEISTDVDFDYTLDGNLMGHIYLGAQYVDSLIDKIENFPEEKRKQIIHLILSHQGYKEDGFGSPVDPATLEATFFHHLDNLDAKTRHIMNAILEQESQDGFIKSNFPLNLKIYVGNEDLREVNKEKVKKNLFDD